MRLRQSRRAIADTTVLHLRCSSSSPCQRRPPPRLRPPPPRDAPPPERDAPPLGLELLREDPMLDDPRLLLSRARAPSNPPLPLPNAPRSPPLPLPRSRVPM